MQNSGIYKRRIDLVLFFVLAILSLLGTWTAHKGRPRFDWLSELWADRGGYYIYLPATFFYHFNFEKAPPGIDAKTGYGFVLDQNTKRIYTHFYYGEYILLSPFFFATHWDSKILHRDEEGGFSFPYHRIFNFAAVFYLMIGIWFLNKFLRNYFDQKVTWLVLIITFLGTNLMFYALEDTLMSHIYSFATGALFIF